MNISLEWYEIISVHTEVRVFIYILQQRKYKEDILYSMLAFRWGDILITATLQKFQIKQDRTVGLISPFVILLSVIQDRQRTTSPMCVKHVLVYTTDLNGVLSLLCWKKKGQRDVSLILLWILSTRKKKTGASHNHKINSRELTILNITTGEVKKKKSQKAFHTQ